MPYLWMALGKEARLSRLGLVDRRAACAATLHHEKNDQEGAYQAVHALASLFRGSSDRTLTTERKLIGDLEGTLAKLSGHAGEPNSGRGHVPEGGQVDRVSGLPLRVR